MLQIWSKGKQKLMIYETDLQFQHCVQLYTPELGAVCQMEWNLAWKKWKITSSMALFIKHGIFYLKYLNYCQRTTLDFYFFFAKIFNFYILGNYQIMLFSMLMVDLVIQTSITVSQDPSKDKDSRCRMMKIAT